MTGGTNRSTVAGASAPATGATGHLVKLTGDRPEARWLIFPTWTLRSLYLRRTRGRWGYVNLWDDVQGYGLHCVTPAEVERVNGGGGRGR